MSVGSVTVDDDGTVTGSGMALAIFNAFAVLNADLPPATLAQVVTLAAGAEGTVETRNKQGIVTFATALAQGIVPLPGEQRDRDDPHHARGVADVDRQRRPDRPPGDGRVAAGHVRAPSGDDHAPGRAFRRRVTFLGRPESRALLGRPHPALGTHQPTSAGQWNPFSWDKKRIALCFS